MKNVPKFKYFYRLDDSAFYLLFRRRGEKRNKFIVNLKTTNRNGLLVWMNQGPTLKGDFLAVAVIEGKVELSFNLGKQTTPLRISSAVSTNYESK